MPVNHIKCTLKISVQCCPVRKAKDYPGEYLRDSTGFEGDNKLSVKGWKDTAGELSDN